MCNTCGWVRHSERIRKVLSALKDADPVDKPTTLRMDSLEGFAKGVLEWVGQNNHITPTQRDKVDDMEDQLADLSLSQGKGNTEEEDEL